MIGVWDGSINLLDNRGVVKNYVPLPEGELGIEIQARFEAENDITVSFPFCVSLMFYPIKPIPLSMKRKCIQSLFFIFCLNEISSTQA